MKKALFGMAAAGALVVAGAFMPAHAEEAVAAEPVQVTITGTNYCVLCELAQEDVASASQAYGKINALKVTEAKDADGNALDKLSGKTLHYLPNVRGEELLAGEAHAGQTVTVTGRYYPNASVIAVESFEAAAGDDDWDELPVGTMSGQQVL